MGKELEKNKALVEACELDTTVNLHFHHVTASTPPPPLLLSLSLIRILLACHTLDKLEITLSGAENQRWSMPDIYFSLERKREVKAKVE